MTIEEAKALNWTVQERVVTFYNYAQEERFVLCMPNGEPERKAEAFGYGSDFGDDTEQDAWNRVKELPADYWEW